jgi:hypothetical protein
MINEDFKILEDSMAYRPVGTPFVLLFFQGEAVWGNGD